MVSASSSQGDSSSTPLSPGLPGPLDVDATATGTVEALRQAVEAQEAHVCLLRARKAAREALLRDTQRLLATDQLIASHETVVHLVHQAEAGLHTFQRLDEEVDTSAAVNQGDLILTTAPSSPPRGAAGAAESSVDELAHIFHSGVEAQLALITESSFTPPASTLTVQPSSTKEKKKSRTHMREGGGLGIMSAASPPPRSAAMTALLALSASRKKSSKSAMLAALSALELSLVSTSGDNGRSSTPKSGRGVQKVEPAWLRHEDDDGSKNDVAAPEVQYQGTDGGGGGDSTSTDYTDDFECDSSSGSADGQ
ncbi:hypothetical protein JKF63_06165 [Porcisia hertigi]|uniref:Uncharacterized protein n=1 Tax=Porcisia hertigi TaxID=2761500 RepID=A0A836IWQ0_9TRYP|nr:hypothetical protein JKF63_06165 [Porcisia hertigi]